MKKLLALVLALLMVFSMVACGQKEEAPAAKEEETKTEAPKEEAKEETEAAESASGRDDVNLTITSAFQSTDAHGNRAVSELIWRTQIYEPLFYMNEITLEYEPRLATEYSVSDDGLVYTFKLREDVKFHNGEPMKASDVVFSYEHIKNEKTWSTFYSNIDYAEAIDDYTVAVHFLTKSAAAMNNVSQIWIESEKEVTEQGEAFGTQACLAGTGAYYIEEFSENKVVLKAFDDYYRGEAPIETVTYRTYAEANAAVMALEAGEIDHYAVPAANFPSFQAMDNFSNEVMAANHITYACINYSANDVLANDLVREAIAYAIDKEAMSIATFDGNAIPADYMENPAYNVAAPEADIVYNYNPEKAKELLAEAGYPNGVDIGAICTSASNYFGDVAVVMQSNLADVGITATLDVMENSACIAALRAQEYDVGILGYSNTGDYDSFRQRVHSDNVGGYFVKFEGDKFDYQRFNDLFAEQLAELDLEKRMEITAELNDAVMETCCLLPLFYKPNLYVWNADLNVVNTPNFPEIYNWSWN